MRRAAPAELPALTPARYRLRQVFRYDYDGPGRDLVHRLVVVPPDRHGDQRLLSSGLTVSDRGARVSWRTGPDGVRVAFVRLGELPAVLKLSVVAVVERGRPAPLLPAARARDAGLLLPTDLTRPDARMRAVARALAGPDPLATVDRLSAAVHARVAYVPGATTVRTTAAQAWDLGAGVCQDQAHALLALCRSVGVPARYVSGHLLGQGGTHAWVEVIVPAPGGTRVVAYDPCHDRRPGRPGSQHDGYVTVAVGRDYADVAPTSGWYTGPARGVLTCERELTVDALQEAS